MVSTPAAIARRTRAWKPSRSSTGARALVSPPSRLVLTVGSTDYRHDLPGPWPEIYGKLNADPQTIARFNEVYVDGLQIKNIADALVTYQRSLLTPNSRFDKYLRGDKTALTADEVKGYMLFKSNGCVACHQGMNIGSNMYQVFGVVGMRGGMPQVYEVTRYASKSNSRS